jgi:hypothetical protein
MARLLILALIVLTLLAASCGGSAAINHTGSDKPVPLYSIVSDVEVAGAPCTIRCRVVLDASIENDDTRQVDDWTWTVANGTVVVENDALAEAWIEIPKPSACTLSARGVDKDGRDCTTPRHKLTASKKANADPVLVVDEALNQTSGEDPLGSGEMAPWSQATWSCRRSYDPDGDDPLTDFDWRMSNDLSDGEPEVIIATLLRGEPTPCDLDGDGYMDIVIIPTPGSQTEFTVRFYFITLEPDGHAMHNLHLEGQSAAGRRKGWDGCIYGNRPPGKG